ncbi:succinate dehydrogenase, cytochrome b556 subunit, partial [Neisseria sp. P0017.S006]
DVHKGLELNTARATAKVVFASALILTVVLGALLW